MWPISDLTHVRKRLFSNIIWHVLTCGRSVIWHMSEKLMFPTLFDMFWHVADQWSDTCQKTLIFLRKINVFWHVADQWSDTCQKTFVFQRVETCFDMWPISDLTHVRNDYVFPGQNVVFSKGFWHMSENVCFPTCWDTSAIGWSLIHRIFRSAKTTCLQGVNDLEGKLPWGIVCHRTCPICFQNQRYLTGVASSKK